MSLASRLGRCACLIVACAVLPSGCGDGGDEPQLKRIIILTNGTSPFWDAAKIGAMDAAKDLDIEGAGLRVVVDTNDFSDTGQINKLREYQGMTDVVAIGISVTNSDNASIADEMRKLRKSGIYVITIDSDVDRRNDRSAREAYVGTDNVYGGGELGKAAKGLKPEGAEYCTFVGLKGAANAKERIGGFGVGAGAGFTQKESFGDGGDAVVARKNVRDAIDRNPGLNMLVGIWSYNAPAIVDIVKQLDRRKDFTICCFDAEPIAIDYMEAGMIDVLAVQNPYKMGYEGVRLLKALYEKDEAGVEAMRRRMKRGADADVFDTGLKIIVPEGESPLDKVQMGEATEKMKLGEFKKWLESKGLTGS
jgi:ribose transport system substrate-binding protein